MTIKMKTTSKLILPIAFGLPFFLGFESGGFQLALLMISDSFQIGTKDMGMLVSLQFAGTILGPLIFGSFINRVSKKYSSLLGITLFSSGCFLLLIFPELTAFFIGVFVLGMGFSISQTCSSAALSDAFPGKASKYINLAQCFFSGGAVISPILTNYVLNEFGLTWKFIFYVSGAGYLLLIVPILFTEFARPKIADSQKRLNFPGLIRSTSISYLILAIFIYVGVESGLVYFTALLFTQVFQAPEWNAFAISAVWLAMIPARIAGSFLHKHKYKLLLRLFLVNTLLLCLLGFSSGPTIAFACCLALGLFFGPIWPTLIGMGTEESPENSGGITSILNIASGVGGAVFPVLMGFLADYAGIRVSYIFLGLCSLVGFFSLLLWKKSTKKRAVPKP